MSDYHLGDILSVTTERLVSPRHVDGLYDLLGFMVGEPLWTRQLPRANDECKPALLVQHPDLAEVEVPEEFDGKEHVDRWLAEQVARFGEYRDVQPLAAEDHTSIDPVAELRMLKPDAQIIVIGGAS
jgi:hypothetical protein